MKVKAYYNLHKKVFSVVSLERGENYGKVIAHQAEVFLSNAEFKVSEAGRQRVLREQRKNVHAFVTGNLESNLNLDNGAVAVTYNPYKYQSFVRFQDGQPVPTYRATQAHLKDRQITAGGG